jgi:hypothetical protein
MLKYSLSKTGRMMFMVLIALLMGCSGSNQLDSRSSMAPGTNTSVTSRSTTTIENNNEPTTTTDLFSATLSFTAIPTSSSTTLPTNTPTWTPVPTVLQDEATEIILELYSNNGGCQLPCFWGITPGGTSWEAAREILAPLGSLTGKTISENLDIYYFYAKFRSNSDPFPLISFMFWVKDGFVTAISLNTGSIRQDFDYSLAGILENFGEPQEIWIKINTDTMDLPHYELDLFYPSQGLLFNSSGDAIEINDDFVTICPKEFRWGEYPPALIVWDPSTEYSYKNLGNKLLGGLKAFDSKDFSLFKDLSQDMDEKAFYDTYRNPTTSDCIDIDVD